MGSPPESDEVPTKDFIVVGDIEPPTTSAAQGDPPGIGRATGSDRRPGNVGGHGHDVVGNKILRLPEEQIEETLIEAVALVAGAVVVGGDTGGARLTPGVGWSEEVVVKAGLGPAFNEGPSFKRNADDRRS